MAESKIQMNFKTSGNKKVSISVDNPKESLTSTDIKNVMDGIVTANIFDYKGESLAEVVNAKIITTETEEITF
ncbi:DUF2922 domain-containing protein [Acidilutibacter cellobiosedens]|uniref:DUF2922 domain-containing protein n=1 Tax=Acidilutibacter cellobiosedens TaxID=2507161 RepID=A0A410QD94_9FIRM|nr:DUF2922 domain-containing protein [Acidilutibacter cellobiosedens]QAT61977.1 DUF2922 domain-containing protein [Acidilutibacter cellobiosedens]